MVRRVNYSMFFRSLVACCLLLFTVVALIGCPGSTTYYPTGNHDEHLDATILLLSSSWVKIDGKPQDFRSDQVPKSIPVSLVGVASPRDSQRVKIGLRNLDASRQIDLLDILFDTNAWRFPPGVPGGGEQLKVCAVTTSPTTPLTYQVSWIGGPGSGSSSLQYLPNPRYTIPITLQPGETRTIDAYFTSQNSGDLTWHFEVVYRFHGESQVSPTLVVPNQHRSIFVEPGTWHPYHLGKQGYAVPL